MAFIMDSNIARLQEKEVKGKHYEAAVDCWFTTTGKVFPRFAKIMNNTGEIITIRDIRVLKEEDKFYAGIPARKYWCKSEDGGIEKEFYLMFYPDERKWKLII